MIIPVILEETLEGIETRIEQINGASKLIQIDIADENLVEGKTYLNLVKILEIETMSDLEIHLMVRNPFYFLEVLKQHPKNKKVVKISTQVEAFPEENSFKTLQEWLDKARDLKHLKTGLSLNPETPIKIIESYTDQLDFIQLLSVAPGKQGQSFNPKLLEKILQTKQKYPSIPLQIDGGINKDNLQSILQAGADNVVIGSAIFNTSSPIEAFMNLERIENKWKTKL